MALDRFTPCVRSIPALAGEPTKLLISLPQLTVYPRACGGTTRNQSFGRTERGLSPRLRGNQRCNLNRMRCGGSIPALAGEPASAWSPATLAVVYPRACGGTRPGRRGGPGQPGLSPRLRGNPHSSSPKSPGIGSIPALAGEPSSSGLCTSAARVYPRACGGT